MLRLHLLGAPYLEGPSGTITGRAVQRRRLAVLARLALAHGAPMTRDLLSALFWPDSPQEQAHRSLSAALYDLRRVLGDAALPGAGEEVRLDPSRIWCDAVAFEEAASAGRLEEAAALWSGPLMEGVHFGADGAEEWERWVDDERTRLTRLYATVLERLAGEREATGDATGAVDALLRLARVDPYGARTVLRLMGALARSGERARALQEARLYATRMRKDLEAEPEPAILALEQRLRQESPRPPESQRPVDERGPEPDRVPPSSAAAAELRPHVEPRSWARSRWAALVGAGLLILGGFGGYAAFRTRSARAGPPDPTIAVLPFENLSAQKGDDYLADGLSEDLLTRLARVPGLRVISHSSVIRYQSTRKPVRQIGEELGADFVLEGSIQRAGDRVRLNAQLIDARNDRHVWAERYDRELPQVLQVQTEVSEAIAAALVATLMPRQKALLATGGTNDPLAYDLYLRGLRWLNVNRDSGTRSLRKAIAVDPAFALPHASLAWMYARDALRRGWRDSATMEGRRALELDPRNTTARRALAGLYMTIAQGADAEKLLRAALEIDPNDTEALNLLSVCAAAAGRTRESIALRAAVLRLDPLNAQVYVHLTNWLTGLGAQDLAIVAARRATQLGDIHAAGALAQLYMNRGDFAAARAVASELRTVASPADLVARGILAEAAARQGDWVEAQRQIDSGFGLVSFEPGLFPGYVALRLGHRARADSLLAPFERDLQQRRAAGFSVLRARIRLAAIRGDREGAVALLKQAVPEGYRVCLPRRSLYMEGLDGYPPYEAYRDDACAQQARLRDEMEKNGALAELRKLVAAR